jgi:hypothetical protein
MEGIGMDEVRVYMDASTVLSRFINGKSLDLHWAGLGGVETACPNCG